MKKCQIVTTMRQSHQMVAQHESDQMHDTASPNSTLTA